MRSLLLVTCQNRDDRWLSQPGVHIRKMEGQSLSLAYKYARPPSSPRRGKLFFGRRTPADGPETNLMEADVDPDTGDMTVVYTREHNKVNITYYKQGFDITVYNMSHSETGLYLTDLNFDLDAALHDSFTVTVFTNPDFKHAPPAVLQPKISSNVTLKWQLRHHPALPRVTNLTVLYSKNLERDLYSTTLISHTMDPQTEQWQLIYPDKEKQYVDRISYATGPKHELIELTLWDLRSNDSGEYQLLVEFKSNLTRLENQTTLHVMPDYKWINSPRHKEYVMMSRDLQLNFTFGDLNETKDKEIFELVKHVSEKEDVTVLTSTKTQNDVQMKTLTKYDFKWRVKYGAETGSASLTLSSADDTDSGKYTVRVKGHSGYVLMDTTFNIYVLNENNLVPFFTNTTSDLGTRTIGVHFNNTLQPDQIQTTSDQNHVTTNVQTDGIKTFEISAPDTVRTVTVLIVYSEFNFRINKTLVFTGKTTIPSVFHPPNALDQVQTGLHVVILIINVAALSVIFWMIKSGYVNISCKNKQTSPSTGRPDESPTVSYSAVPTEAEDGGYKTESSKTTPEQDNTTPEKAKATVHDESETPRRSPGSREFKPQTLPYREQTYGTTQPPR